MENDLIPPDSAVNVEILIFNVDDRGCDDVVSKLEGN